MSYLLEVLGRGLLAELSRAFRDVLKDDGRTATKDLETAALFAPDDAENQRRLAVRLLLDRQYARAQSGFHKTLEFAPGDRVARIGLACTFDELGRTRTAVEHLAEALGEDPRDATALLSALGFCQEKLGETDLAAKSYQQALEFAPQLRNAHERLAAIHLKRNETDAAIAHYEHVCWEDPGDINTVLTLANLYLRVGRSEDAVKRFEFAITIDPENWEAKEDLVSAHAAAGDFGSAITVIQESIARRPESADLHLRLGDLHNRKGDDNLALESYNRALELHPDYLEAAVKVGTSHLRRGAYEKAARAFARATEINDRILHAYVGLGVAQHAAGRPTESLASLEQAASIEPNSTLLFSEVARLQLKVAAAQQQRRLLAPGAMAVQPSGPPEQRVASMIERQIAQLREGVTRHPNHADLHYRLGLLLRHGGDLRGAIESFQRAVDINPQYLKALIKLALALREGGETEQAIQVARRALDMDAESLGLHYELGLLYADRNQFSLALDRFDHAAQRAPRELDYVANLALCLQNMGLSDRAKETWRLLAELQTAQDQAQHSTDTPQRLAG